MKQKGGSKGQALVEFALVMPLLFMLLFGIIEFGYLFYHHYCLADGVRQGALAGAAGLDDAKVRKTVISTSNLDILPDHIRVKTPQSKSSGSPLEVAATYDHRLLTPILGKKSITLSFVCRATMEVAH